MAEEPFEQLVGLVAEAKGADPLAPVTVVVPSNYSGLSLRRRLARRLGGVVNVQFLTIARLAELLGAPALAAAGRKPLTKAVRTEALRAGLSAEPGAFVDVATHPATLEALDATFADLRLADDNALESVAAMSPRAADVVRLFRATRNRLADRYYDEHDLAAAASGDAGAVVVYLPRGLPASMQAMIERLGSAVVSRTIDAPPPVDEVVSTEDPDEEVRAAVRLVTERLRTGTPLHRIAVLWSADEPYAGTVHQQLDAAGIPHNGPATRTLAYTVTGTALLQLLALPDRDFRRDDVMAWLASAPIIELVGARHTVPASQWDVVSSGAGVIGGAAHWHGRLVTYAAEQSNRKEELAQEDDVEPWRLERIDRHIDHAGRMRVFVAELAALLAVDAATWTELSEWATRLLDRYLGADDQHYSWPDAEQDAWRRVRGALEQLSALDDVGTHVDLRRFRQAVAAELAAPAARNGQFGKGVFTAHLRAALGTDFDVAIVLGLAEGTLPSRRREDALLPDRERLAAGGAVSGRGDRQEEERDDLWSALQAARKERVLLWPRTDPRRRRERLRSRWVPADADERRIDSFQQGLVADPPATLVDYDLRDLLHWTERGGEPLDHVLANELASFSAGVWATESRADARFTRFDGNVGPGRIDPLDARAPMSPTSLEQYAECPARYFYSKVLHLNAPERPEEIRRIAPMTKGSLVHEVLEQFILDVIADPSARNEAQLLDRAEAAFEKYYAQGVTGAPLLWRYERELVRRELLRFLAEDDDGAEPLAAELSFGRDGETPVVLTLPNGREIGFRGTADRVDRLDDGTIRVTDYKTGSDFKYKALADDTVARGKLLQLPLYGLAARARFGGDDTPVTSRYWMIAEKSDFRSHNVVVDDDAVDRLREVLGILVDGITAGRFPARPAEEDWRGGWDNCRYCDFDRVCQADRDRAWERVRATSELESYVALAEGDGGD